ncbi:MAG TPA: YceI family protein [Candidatus Acidoferrales bacterium]
MAPLRRFTIDAQASRLTAHAFASGLVKAVLHNPKFAVRNFAGEVDFSGASLTRAKVKLAIQTTSLALLDEVSVRDYEEIRRVTQEEVLEGELFPEILFESSEIKATKISKNLYNASITGNLSLHGRTQVQVIECQVVASKESVRAIGHFNVRQTDFGIKITSIAGNTLKMEDEVKIGFFILAQKASS